MNRTELIVVTAAVLFVAFCLGWFVSWLLHSVTRVAQRDLGELDHMAQAVHEAEEERDQARAELRAREHDLTGRLAQSEAELRAAMDGLRVARAENEALREKLETAE
jgi:hypothetical protein